MSLDPGIREQTDDGHPPRFCRYEWVDMSGSMPRGEIASRSRLLAGKVAGRLSLQGRDQSAVFPEIVIEKA